MFTEVVRKMCVAAAIACLGLVTAWGCSPSNAGGGGGAGNTNDNGGTDNTNTNTNGGGADNSNTNSNGGGGGNIGSLNVMVTDVPVGTSGWIRAGDDLIVVGTERGAGVEYLIPSQGDTSGRTISNFDVYVTNGFAIAGKWIILRDFDGNVTAFNTETETAFPFDETELSTFGGAGTPDTGDFWAAGDMVCTWVDTNRTTTPGTFKLIDFSGSTPQIISFSQDPPELPPSARTNERIQMAIDGGARQFAVQIQDQLSVYSFDSPDAAPEVYDFSDVGGIRNTTQMWLENGYLLYHDYEGAPNGKRLTRLANLATSEVTLLETNPSADEEVVLMNGIFGYFVYVTEDDVITNGQSRVVFGTVTDGSTVFAAGTDDLIGDERDDGLLGYGQTVTITPDGRYRFIAGGGLIAVAEYLQVSTGGVFATLTDPTGRDPRGMQGSEVHASNSVCAFQSADHTVAYIRLD